MGTAYQPAGAPPPAPPAPPAPVTASQPNARAAAAKASTTTKESKAKIPAKTEPEATDSKPAEKPEPKAGDTKPAAVATAKGAVAPKSNAGATAEQSNSTALVAHTNPTGQSHASTAVVSHTGKKNRFKIPRPGDNGAVAGVLDGKRLVLTGLFPEVGGGTGLSLGKDRTKSMIESFGGKITSGISGKTDCKYYCDNIIIQ